ncbi:kinase-like domain-containing protein [Pestalotiopsis sp. NC0098]|nr:kinase-like domain-containing protein [Pestalotiopsis sp. NC0098]
MEFMYCDLESYLQRSTRSGGRELTWKVKQPEIKLQGPIRQLINGLRVLHDQGIAHRDLRPKNIFVDRFGNLKIGDFGISKRTMDGHLPAKESLHETWGYTAPEVITAVDSIDPIYSTKVDIWSLGCVLYRMLTGKRLFTSLDDTRLNLDARLASLDTLSSIGLGITDTDVLFLKMLICKQEMRLTTSQAYSHNWFKSLRN